jgi:uncharacterized protein (DUF1697 family)
VRSKRRPTSSKHVALLRGINVGGKNMLRMKELDGMFVAAECEDVTTYIQSGNVIFRADEKVLAGLGGVIARKIEERFGIRVPVVLRTAVELETVLRSNPFLKAGAAEDALHVYFLNALPGARDVAGLEAARFAPDAFEVVAKEIYLNLPNGMARTKLTNGYFDSKLRTVSTARNWRTVLKLAQLTASE